MVQVNVNRGKNHIVVIVLNVRKRSLQMRPVMVIDQRNSTGDFLVSKFLTVFNQLRADHVRNRLRTIIIAFFVSHLVQLIKQ